MNKALLPDRLFLSAEVNVGDNGEGAKTAPVSIVASTGQPVDYPGLGVLVFDLSTMTPAKSRIPLDLDHSDSESIGYLNRFDVTNGQLVVKGAIVPFGEDDGARVLHHIANGVPYQASVESHDYVLEYVEEGLTANVNARDLNGPLFIARDWSLDAVAVCKWGKDDDTSVSLAASKAKTAQAQKVLFVRMSNNTAGETEMDDTKKKAATVEATTEPVVEVAAASDEQVKVEPVAEVVASVEAVEAVPSDEPADAEVVDEQDEAAVEVEIEIDPRAEFKAFVEKFGEAQAAKYFAADMSLDQAKDAHIAHLSEQVQASQKVAASKVAGGVAKPIVFNDTATKNEPVKAKKTMADIVRFAGSSK